jgi:lipid-A-disaccharide synthase-like uncharacterized protein
MWLIIGFIGQGVFGARFFIQWLYSEKYRKSIIPDIFWYISILGGMVLLAYALHKKDPVFIMGQFMGLFIYARNIYFIREAKKQQKHGTQQERLAS